MSGEEEENAAELKIGDGKGFFVDVCCFGYYSHEILQILNNILLQWFCVPLHAIYLFGEFYFIFFAEFLKAKCLMNCEVAVILEHKYEQLQQMSDDPLNQVSQWVFKPCIYFRPTLKGLMCMFLWTPLFVHFSPPTIAICLRWDRMSLGGLD